MVATAYRAQKLKNPCNFSGQQILDELARIKQDSQTKLSSSNKRLCEWEEALAQKEWELPELNERLELARKNEEQLNSQIALGEQQKKEAIDRIQDKKNTAEQARLASQTQEEEARCQAAAKAEHAAAAEQQAKAVQETLDTDPLGFTRVLAAEIRGEPAAKRARMEGPAAFKHTGEYASVVVCSSQKLAGLVQFQ